MKLSHTNKIIVLTYYRQSYIWQTATLRSQHCCIFRIQQIVYKVYDAYVIVFKCVCQKYLKRKHLITSFSYRPSLFGFSICFIGKFFHDRNRKIPQSTTMHQIKRDNYFI